MKRSVILFAVIFIISQVLNAQETKTISGTIISESGKTLPGVFVHIEHTNRGTISDKKGFYKIDVLSSDKYLVFSSVGMKTQQIKIRNKSIINVTMQTKYIASEENVVEAVTPELKNETSLSVVKIRASHNVLLRSVAHKSGIYHAGGIMPPPVNWNTENYATIHENGFKSIKSSPLSTFSIDVDNASYSNVRRYINQGALPPKDAVRVEEMINYFPYDYPEPAGEHPLSITSELGECPWNSNHYLLHVGLKGKSIDKSELPPSNLVFLLDVSGSMKSPNKLPLLKSAFKLLVNELRSTDRVAIIVYAGAAGVVLESTPGNEKNTIMKTLDKLSAGGSTAGGEGLKLAYKIAKQNFLKAGNNRIILATDGDFNVGVSSTSEMERLVVKERENGVYMSVLGFGSGNIKDDKMEVIADKGNGNYSYIDNIQEARKVFITEFGGILFTIAKDVKFQLEFNPVHAKAYRLIGYENRLLNDEDFNDDKKDAGEMGAGHTVTALYEIIPAGSDESIPGVDPLKYQSNRPVSGKASAELLTMKIRYKKPEGKSSRLVEVPVPNKRQKNTSENFRFSAAVAEFGMLLRNSEFKGRTSIDSVLELALDARGNDADGYRSAFIQLVKTVEDLQLLASE